MQNGNFTEGVYMASGSPCYSADAYIHQKPETGRDTYVIQVNGKHDATHTVDKQTLTISFNQNVTHVNSKGKLVSGDGSNTLVINYGYHNNPTDNIGLGDLEVSAGDGLEITSVSITDNPDDWY
ncbi:MAG: hypothetical protein HFH68_06905 [Lachnospiraceae bacterium]|nr:hypothetical protein [Lachnospiraceae bacterium]